MKPIKWADSKQIDKLSTEDASMRNSNSTRELIHEIIVYNGIIANLSRNEFGNKSIVVIKHFAFTRKLRRKKMVGNLSKQLTTLAMINMIERTAMAISATAPESFSAGCGDDCSVFD